MWTRYREVRGMQSVAFVRKFQHTCRDTKSHTHCILFGAAAKWSVSFKLGTLKWRPVSLRECSLSWAVSWWCVGVCEVCLLLVYLWVWEAEVHNSQQKTQTQWQSDPKVFCCTVRSQPLHSLQITHMQSRVSIHFSAFLTTLLFTSTLFPFSAAYPDWSCSGCRFSRVVPQLLLGDLEVCPNSDGIHVYSLSSMIWVYPRDLLLVRHVQKISNRRCPWGILTECLNSPS